MERVLDLKNMDPNEFKKEMEKVAKEFDTVEKREMLSPGRAISPKKKSSFKKDKPESEMDEEEVDYF